MQSTERDDTMTTTRQVLLFQNLLFIFAIGSLHFTSISAFQRNDVLLSFSQRSSQQQQRQKNHNYFILQSPSSRNKLVVNNNHGSDAVVEFEDIGGDSDDDIVEVSKTPDATATATDKDAMDVRIRLPRGVRKHIRKLKALGMVKEAEIYYSMELIKTQNKKKNVTGLNHRSIGYGARYARKKQSRRLSSRKSKK